jgi:hypothetical protein
MSEPDEELQIVTESGPFALVPIWVLDFGLGGSELAVYVAMRSFANRHGEGWPRVKAIAERANVAKRTAEKAISRFRELGLLTSVQRHREDGSIKGCTYYMRDVPLTGRRVVAAGSPVPPVRTAGTPPGELDGVPPAQETEQEQTTRTDQREQTTQEQHAREKNAPTKHPALVLAEQLIEDAQGRITVPAFRLAGLLAPALANGTPAPTLALAVGRVLAAGKPLAPWSLQEYVAKVANSSSSAAWA